jgi:hypothetical protein
MQDYKIQPQPWWVVALGILPGILIVVGQFTSTIISASWVLQTWAVLITTILSLSGYFIVNLHKKTTLIWTFPGISISIAMLLPAAFNLITAALPTQATGMLVGYQIINTITSLLGLSLFIASIVIGAYLARRYQSVSALLASGWIALGAYGFMDPTYGFFIWFENRLFPAMMDAICLIPFLILLPIWVLRARSEEERRKGFLSMSALSLVLMILIPIMRDVAMWEREVSGAQPLHISIPRTLMWGTLYASIFWGILLGIIFLYSRTRNSSPPMREQNAAI